MKVLALDNSLLKTIAACSTQAVATALRYGEVHPSGALEAGTLLHAVVARHLCGVEVGENLGTLASEWADLRQLGGWLFSDDHVGVDSPHPDRKPQYRLDNLTAIATAWLAKHPQPDPFPNLAVPPEWVEIAFQLPLERIEVNGESYLVVIVGQIDAVGEEGNCNDLWTVETKTTGSIVGWWELKFRSDTQNTTYQWAAEETLGREVIGTFVNAIETKDLPTSERTCAIHTYDQLPPDHIRLNQRSTTRPLYSECGLLLHPVSKFFALHRDPQLVVDWKKDALALATKFVELDKFVRRGIVGATKTRTEGRFIDACTFCPIEGWCIGAARKLSFIEYKLARRPERPNVKVGIFNSEEEFFDNGKRALDGV